MRFRALHSRQDLIDLVSQRPPTPACGRAIREGRATVLGLFSEPEGLPRFIVQVDSKFGRRWFIAVVIDEEHLRIKYEYPDIVEWKHYMGQESDRQPANFADGDDPRLYRLYRAEGVEHDDR
jgi:hypothetical protein